MSSLKRHDGYLLIDHRFSPGMPAGLGVGPDRVLEAATYTCSHCQRVVVKNPERTRERAYCPKCDHLLCDGCGAIRAANGGECRPMKQVLDEAQEAAARAEQAAARGIILPS